jgi:hypothetical protein
MRIAITVTSVVLVLVALLAREGFSGASRILAATPTTQDDGQATPSDSSHVFDAVGMGLAHLVLRDSHGKVKHTRRQAALLNQDQPMSLGNLAHLHPAEIDSA